MVKVQRPHIDQIVEIDLAALRVVGGWLQRYPPIRKRANIPRLLEEFATTLYEEIDYLNEGKNAETFATNFTQRSNIRIPGVYWSHTTRRVLTLVNVEGIKITNYAAIEEAGIDRVEVARRLFATYLQQIFEDRFFHADPHPGNLFVQPLNSKSQDGHTEFQIVFVDFGMVGKVGPTVFTGLRELLIAIGTRDAVRMVSSFKTLDVLLPSANIELLQKATARAFERFWGKSTAQMMDMHKDEAAQFVQEFGELMYEMPFQFPENFILLGRCLGILSGICTGLDPDFNMWSNISPYASKLVTAEGGSRQWLNEIGRFLQILVSLPGRTDAMLTRLEQGNLEVRAPGLQDQIHHLEHATHRLAAAIILAAFLLSAVQLSLGSQTIPAIICGMAAVIALGWLLIKR